MHQSRSEPSGQFISMCSFKSSALCLAFESRCIWVILHLSHVAFKSHCIWVTLHLSYLAFESRCIWVTLRLSHVAFDSRYIRVTLHVSHIAFESSCIWVMYIAFESHCIRVVLHSSHVAFRSCCIRATLHSSHIALRFVADSHGKSCCFVITHFRSSLLCCVRDWEPYGSTNQSMRIYITPFQDSYLGVLPNKSVFNNWWNWERAPFGRCCKHAGTNESLCSVLFWYKNGSGMQQILNKIL